MFNLNFIIMPKTSMLDHRANLSRSGFDMSQSLAFTASTGMILPIYSDFLNAGESVYYKSDLFARTQPLVTAAMADVDVYIDWFFVPMTMLFTPWGQIRWQTNDFISSLFITGQQPNANSSVGSVLRPGNSGQGFSGFPLLSDVSFDVGTNYNLQSVFSLAPYQPQTPSSSQITQPDSIYYPATLGFEVAGKSLYRMLDLLGFNPYGVFQSVPDSPHENPDVFPVRALAYQCIYQNYFRNDDYEVRDVCSYNWDRYWNATSAVDLGSNGNSINPRNPFLLRYADYRRDYFTSVRPSPIMSAINSISNPWSTGSTPTNNNQTAFNILQNVYNTLGTTGQAFSPGNNNSSAASIGPTNSVTQGSSYGQTVTQFSQNTGSAGGNYVTTANLRSLFAVEKLMRITGRAAKDYDSQTLAHFGFKIPHDVKHQITHLHGSSAVLHIGEVISTADTSGSQGTALGEIAGKGYISLHEDRSRKFTAPVDGIIMTTFRAIPRVRAIAGFDKQNAITDRLSLYVPEFDKLGAQPLFAYEAGFNQIGTSIQLGWQNRYEQFKRKYDRVSSVFFNAQKEETVNQYAAWVLTYQPFDVNYDNYTFNPSIVGTYLKCPPTALNNIMAVPYQPTVSSSFATTPFAEFYTDPFICDFRANVKKVSTMSPTGEPDMVSL